MQYTPVSVKEKALAGNKWQRGDTSAKIQREQGFNSDSLHLNEKEKKGILEPCDFLRAQIACK